MPIDPGMVEALATATAALYEGAEQRLLAILARFLAADMDGPDWLSRKLAAIRPLRAATQAVTDDLADGVPDVVRTAIADAYGTGARAAVDELGLLGRAARHEVDAAFPQVQAIDRLAAETVDVVTSTHRGILRGVEDGYRQVIAEVSGNPLLGVDTRRQATQDAMRRFAARGITSFTDVSGRRWQLTSYAEMAVRTSVARAATEAHAQTLTAAGVDLVIVSDSPRECPLCRRWEGKVLALSGPDGPHDVQAEHGTEDDRIVTVHVAGTLDEARRAGLQHPNCRHSTSAYLPGVTRPIKAKSDPDGYEAGQRQRAIERTIRKWKREQAGSITPEGKRAANARVRQWQAVMRQHLKDNPDLRRLPHREQVGAGNLPRT